jgi:tetratricopeptide (TPR) repeat protein
MKYVSGVLGALLLLSVVAGGSAAPDVQGYIDQGIKASQAGKYDQALQAFDQALKLKPNDPALITFRGIVYYARGQNDLAMKEFEAAIKLNPSFGRAYYQRGMIYQNQEKYDLAVTDLTKAKSLGYGIDPDFIELIKKKAAEKK